MPSLESKKAASQLSSVAAAVIIHHLINRLASSGLDHNYHLLFAASVDVVEDIFGSSFLHRKDNIAFEICVYISV